MKIPHEFPQFQGQKVLLVVTGKQAGKVYQATGGKLTFKLTMRLRKARYTDREGFFETHGGGHNYQSGSVYEPQDDYLVNQFSKKLSQKIHELLLADKKIASLFLFCPEYLENLILKALLPSDRKKVKTLVPGNYMHTHSLEILQKIRDTREVWKRPRPKSPEAQNILKHAAQAQSVAGKFKYY